ncbi:MAG TPA: HPr family phosphocarrier protein [Trebonia sp.]|jgi:phosphotransferase system HPr (HPr) family protein|nr:HPr family phosphocarrier protein [Trebonia sp.]
MHASSESADRAAGGAADSAPGGAADSAPGGIAERTITLAGDLHARPAGALSVAAAKFTSSVRLTAGGREADAKSVLAVMQLGAAAGTPVTVSASGPDASGAVDAILAALAAATRTGES